MDPVVSSMIVSLAALVLTPLSVFITNCHHRKMYDRKFVAEHKVKAIEDYLENIGRFVFGDWKEGYTVSQGMSTIFMYAPEELHVMIEEMNSQVVKLCNMSAMPEYPHGEYAKARTMYIELCKAFSVVTKNKTWYRESKTK